MRTLTGLTLSLLLIAGCSDSVAVDDAATVADMAVAPPPDLAPPELAPGDVHGDVHGYAINQITLPMAKTDFAIDLNGDGKTDNQLGVIIAVLSTQMLDVQLGIDQAIALGTLNFLITLQTIDATLDHDPAVGVTYHLGKPLAGMFNLDDGGNRIPDGGCTACADFSGMGMFTVDQSVAPALLLGPLAAHHFSSVNPITTHRPVTLVIRLALFMNVPPIDLVVNGAHLEFDTGIDPASKAPGLLKGRLQGSVKNSDVQKTVIPAIAALLTEQIKDYPDSATTMRLKSIFDTGGCANADNSMAKAKDGKIDPCEVAQNPLIQAILNPDVQIYDANGKYAPNPANAVKDSLSIAIGLTAVAAKVN